MIRWAFVAATCLGSALLCAAPAAAQPEQHLPPELDVPAALAALEDQQVYRAPGAVARFDEQRVLDALPERSRLLVGPYSGPRDETGHYPGEDDYLNQVYTPMEEWANKRHLTLIHVEGIDVSLLGEHGGGTITPTDIGELRQRTAYLDVTNALVGAARIASGLQPEEALDIPDQLDDIVTPTRSHVDELAGRLRDDRIYQAPGREDDPIDRRLLTIAEKLGIPVRIAAFPVLERGQPLADYAPALAKRYPDDVIMVAYGRWLDIAAPYQDKAISARNYAFGRFEMGSFAQGSLLSTRIATVLTRLDELLEEIAFGRPQPPPQPEPQPYDVRRTISALAPWALLGSATILGGVGLVAWRRQDARQQAEESAALRTTSAEAMAKISELSAALLAAEERGEPADQVAAERLATARAQFDQAHTAAAMVEVGKIAEEGLAAAGPENGGEAP